METRFAGGAARAGRENPWTRIEPAYTWDDLVLPERALEVLRGVPAELSRRQNGTSRDAGANGSRHGVVLLFAGEPGTGKSMAAEVLGSEVGRSIVQIDMSALLARPSGVAEELLEQLFSSREHSDAILFFDGAGAILRRKTPGEETNGERAIEASDVLERAQRYPGLVIFGSRLMRRLDASLADRLDAVVAFPFPEADARREIWRRHLPDDAKVSEPDLDYLASSFRLPGAAIHTCCEAAVGAATREGVPVQTGHIARALQRGFRSWVLSDETRQALDRLFEMSGAGPGTAPGLRRVVPGQRTVQRATAPAAPVVPPVPPAAAPVPPAAPAVPPVVPRVPEPTAGASAPTEPRTPEAPPAAEPPRQAAPPEPPTVPETVARPAAMPDPAAAPPPAEPAPAPAEPRAPRRPLPRPSMPRPSLPRPSLPRPSLSVPRPRVRVPAPRVPRPSVRRPRGVSVPAPAWIALAVLGTIAAAVIGFLVAHSGSSSQSPAPLNQHAAAGAAEVSYPSGWRVLPASAAPAVGLSNPVALSPTASSSSREKLVVGIAKTSPPTLLPQTLLATLPAAPSPQVVTLGQHRFYRYLNLSAGGGVTESAYATPATIGTVVALCEVSSPSSTFTGDCERVLATLRLSSGQPLPLGLNVTYAKDLSQVLAKLNVTRSSAGAQLARARDAAAQAKAASQLAAAHNTAAASLLRLDAGPAKTANAALATALRSTGDAYTALSRAASRNDARGYRAAQGSLAKATRAVNAALAQLTKLGYQVR